jgi:hypothetical protein
MQGQWAESNFNGCRRIRAPASVTNPVHDYAPNSSDVDGCLLWNVWQVAAAADAAYRRAMDRGDGDADFSAVLKAIETP